MLDVAITEVSSTPRRGILWGAIVVWCVLWMALAGWDLRRDQLQLAEAEASIAVRSQAFATNRDAQVSLELEALSQKLKTIQTAHRARMTEADVLNGVRASRLHQEEWEARLRREAKFAHTVLESNLLKMELVARDTSLSTAQSLHTVATLASPPHSRVLVTPEGSRFHVRVAFEMGSLSWEEAGTSTKHETTKALRSDAERMSARVLRDVLTACGVRDIERITVSCNRPLTFTPAADSPSELEPGSTPRVQRPRMASIFRASVDHASAAGIGDWRGVSLPQIGKLARVDFDRTVRLQIHSTLPGDRSDLEPEGELEF